MRSKLDEYKTKYTGKKWKYIINIIIGYHMWIGLSYTANIASLTASDKVGWAWQVLAISSEEPPYYIASNKWMAK